MPQTLSLNDINQIQNVVMMAFLLFSAYRFLGGSHPFRHWVGDCPHGAP